MNAHAKVPNTTEARRDATYETRSTYHPETYKGESPIKCKKLGHFVYEVTDVERTAKFWTEAMGFIETDRNAHGMVFFRCGADHHGIGLKPMREGKSARRDMKGSLQVEHLAFEVENVEVLKKAKAWLMQNNIPIVFEGRKGAGCNISINFLDPDGYEFEIYCMMDQVDETNRLRPKSQFLRTNTIDEAIAKPVPKTW